MFKFSTIGEVDRVSEKRILIQSNRSFNDIYLFFLIYFIQIYNRINTSIISRKKDKIT